MKARLYGQGQPEMVTSRDTGPERDHLPEPKLEPEHVLHIDDLPAQFVREATFEDRTRKHITSWLLLVFTITILATFLFTLIPSDSQSVTAKELLDALLPAETALLGSAMGFYFGSKKG